MSNQLTIAAAFSVLAMAVFALASPQFAVGAGDAHGVLGMALEATAPVAGKAPALPGLADFIH